MSTVRRQLDRLFAVHMVIAVVTGALCFLTPHSLMSPILGDTRNTHMAHEFGYMVWRTRLVSDALIRRTFCQAYCICFLLQAMALLRAQMTSPESHSMLHWVNILLLGGLGGVYGYFLVFKTIKAFELPGMNKGLL
ncbi:hypothetical protein KXD40_004583 [Peronospora effusa]|uniref:Uncharacterized protein n=1 Tax=Peronospora effusa TaxID=542832 RepID=A0A3M6VT35_9STRA|nr:hypothetical protein DD238_002629 [Peronospora effusa]RQM16674.1 hypothetical protein DD237_003741 [Peronospora effusa]UIZ28416.1 hypothetical protein KXD40_004583 [Peronospora effusa]CAI5721888.1 unnamed protein product [Peronospora effusa]